MQFENINMQINNVAMQNLSNQFQNIGMQMLNMGIQIINFGVNNLYNSFEMSNLSQQLKDIGNLIQNIGMNIDMKKNMQMIMMNQMMLNKIETTKWNLIFDMQERHKRFAIEISPEKKFKDAIDLFKIEANVDPKGMFFIYNGQKIYLELKISETGLCDRSFIVVIDTNYILGG